ITATGSTSCEGIDQSPSESSGEVPGNTLSQITKIEARNTPEANSGTEVVTMLATEMTRSSFEPSRMPAAMPNTIENTTMITKATAASSKVLPRRSQMMLLTSV